MSRFIKYLAGDLNQFIAQKKHIQMHCISVNLVQDSGFPERFESEMDFEIALSSFWVHQVEGWWNYKEDLIRMNICTEDEFKISLKRRVDERRAAYERESRGWLH